MVTSNDHILPGNASKQLQDESLQGSSASYSNMPSTLGTLFDLPNNIQRSKTDESLLGHIDTDSEHLCSEFDDREPHYTDDDSDIEQSISKDRDNIKEIALISNLSPQQKEFLHLLKTITNNQYFNNETTQKLLDSLKDKEQVTPQAVEEAIDYLKTNSTFSEKVTIGKTKVFNSNQPATFIRDLRSKNKRGDQYYFIVSNLPVEPYCGLIERDPTKNLTLITTSGRQRFDQFLKKFSAAEQIKICSSAAITKIDGMHLVSSLQMEAKNTKQKSLKLS